MATQTRPGSGGTLDFGRAFGFTFDDPEWVKKVLLGGLFVLLSSVFVGFFFVGGYFIRLIQRTARGETQPLPDWDDLGGIFEDGLKPVGVYLVYGLIASVVPMCFLGVLLLLGGGLSTMPAGPRHGEEAVAGMMFLGIVAFYAVLALIMFVFAILLPAALARVAVSGRFGAAFEVREIVGLIGRNLGNYALTLLLFLLVSFLSQFGILLLCVGIFPAVFWSYCVLGWALGETLRRDGGGAVVVTNQ